MFYNSFMNMSNKKFDHNKIRNKLIFFSKDKKNEKKVNLTIKKAINSEPLKEEELNEKCILEKKCPFYKKYIKLKMEVNSFISSREKLKLINQSLYIDLAEKNKIYREIKEENNHLKGIIYNLTGLKFSEILNNKKSSDIETVNRINTIPNIINKTYNPYYLNIELDKKRIHKIKLNLNKNINLNYRNKNLIDICKSNSLNNNNINNKNNMIRNVKFYKKNGEQQKSNNSFNSHTIIDSYDKEEKVINPKTYSYNRANTANKIKIFPKKILMEIDGTNNYYERINNYTKKQKLKINAKEANSSYLCLDIDLMNLLKNNLTLNKLEHFTRNDEKFIKECKTSSNDTLFKYCDSINSLIADYKEIIKLSTRMKDIIKGSILLIDSIISNDCSKKFIEITCNILKCDRASLFLFDKISDKLILYTGEGMKKAQIKVDKNIGIVGACFTECRVIRIEDAYLEKKFNREIDKKKNYRTKSVLCFPLIDKEGDCFGVIEAINKFNSCFTDDDQELLKILSQEASSIFKSLSYNDNNKFLVNKLYLIIDYNIKIQYIDNKYEFSRVTEEMLLNLFSCMNAAFYFIEDNYIIRYNKENEYQKYDMNFGIIGKVIKSKEIIAYKNVKYSEEYNSIIDIKSFDGILTFPIFTKKTKNVCAVIQVPYFGEINKFGKPKENEAKIIKKLCKCIKHWFSQNQK